MTRINSLDDLVQMIKKKMAPASTPDALPVPRVEGDQQFWISNGPILASLVDLRDALVAITDDQFNRHVTISNNDFANWIDSTLHEPALAQKVRELHTRRSIHALLEEYLQKTYGV